MPRGVRCVSCCKHMSDVRPRSTFFGPHLSAIVTSLVVACSGCAVTQVSPEPVGTPRVALREASAAGGPGFGDHFCYSSSTFGGVRRSRTCNGAVASGCGDGEERGRTDTIAFLGIDPRPGHQPLPDQRSEDSRRAGSYPPGPCRRLDGIAPAESRGQRQRHPVAVRSAVHPGAAWGAAGTRCRDQLPHRLVFVWQARRRWPVRRWAFACRNPITPTSCGNV